MRKGKECSKKMEALNKKWYERNKDENCQKGQAD